MEIIDLEMIPGGPKKTCHASQFDNGRVIRFNLKENGQPFALSGTETVQAIIRKPDGSETTLDIANTSSTYVDLITEADTCDLAGVNHCEMKVTEDGEDLGSGNFDMKVEEDAYGAGDVSVGTASGPIASFETDIKDDLIECKGDISYRAEGYKQATFINSRSMPQKDTEPYLFRTAGGSLQNIGGQEHDTLVGGTVAFNQLVQNGNFEDNSGWNKIGENASISVSNNELTFTGSDDALVSVYRPVNATKGHKFIYCIDVKGEDNYSNWLFTFGGAETYNLPITNAWVKYIKIVSKFSDSYNLNIIRKNESAVGEIVHVKNAQLIDLTQMFGSTIADYIYSLEQATAGAGVAFFKNLFPKDYYPYNEGELISVKTSAHIMRDAANNIIGNYALDSDLELRGIPKLINNKLEYDGDTYESNGAVSRKYGIVDLGLLNWSYDSTSGSEYFYVGGLDAKPKADASYLNNALSDIYSQTGYDAVNGNNNKFGFNKVGTYLKVCNLTYSDAASFKTAMNGKYLVYELATPTEETADPFTNPQTVEADGTEEYIDGRTVEMPVGHSTIYGDDIQAKTATFPERIYGGEINMTTGELTSTKNADGTNKATPDTYQLTPKNLEARSGQNNIMNDTNGNTAVKFYTRA